MDSLIEENVQYHGDSYACYTIGNDWHFIGKADSEYIHGVLNIAGYIFDPADAANAAWYGAEGDSGNEFYQALPYSVYLVV